MWQYWGMRVAQRLAATLPNPAQYRLAVLVGELIFHLWRDKSRATLENAAQVLNLPPGDRRVRTVARQCFHNYAKYLVEFFQLPFRTSADLQAKVSQLIGWEHVEAALARGRASSTSPCISGTGTLVGRSSRRVIRCRSSRRPFSRRAWMHWCGRHAPLTGWPPSPWRTLSGRCSGRCGAMRS